MKVFGIEHRLKKGSNLPIWHTIVNDIYVALDKTTTGYYEVICNSNGTQKSGGGSWTDVPVTQRLSELNGTGSGLTKEIGKILMKPKLNLRNF